MDSLVTVTKQQQLMGADGVKLKRITPVKLGDTVHKKPFTKDVEQSSGRIQGKSKTVFDDLAQGRDGQQKSASFPAD